ncbi:MAG: hypothetical protein R3C02_22155 [Planctomycetaceae bacterium]
MFHHLFKLPLYILALPFFILTAVGRGGLCRVWRWTIVGPQLTLCPQSLSMHVIRGRHRS